MSNVSLKITHTILFPIPVLINFKIFLVLRTTFILQRKKKNWATTWSYRYERYEEVKPDSKGLIPSGELPSPGGEDNKSQ
jgi:hypothetical protein